ncbi:MAG: Trk family potassium uptake protein [Clostridiales bacterium]|jgi:trk system potassium uptake protein TrkH|nr:Trk family potassium uptake protein [Clostridiales bacterium]
MLIFKKVRLSLQQSIALGFLLIILLGTALLSLPISNRSAQALSFADALFTATSATCVTGLVIFDTYTQFTQFGQLVILLLIQIGGLGFMSVSIFFLMVVGRKISIKERSLLMESINTPQIGGAVKLVKRVLFITVILEFAGALLLSLRFIPRVGTTRGIYFGIFHAVSAFCNAGFDLMGSFKPYGSLAPFSGDLIVNLVVVLLIISGGIGFIVWDDLMNNGLRIHRYKLHTKVVLSVTPVLIILSAVLFYFLEKDHAFAEMPVGERLLAALFQAVTPRTAGFSTVNTSGLSEVGIVMTMVLMFIGASPGSTGGGVKTSTFLVILLSVISYIRNRNDLNIYGRRLEDSLVRRAFSSITVYLMLVVSGVILILLNQNLPFEKVLFEAFSAIGTVGLSLGVTRELNTYSRFVIILLMFIGRIGSLSLAMALAERKHQNVLRNISERISIG